MDFDFFNKKEYFNRFFFVKTENRKLVLKSLIASCFFRRNLKFFFQIKFLKFNKFTSISFYKNRCLVNN